MNTKLFLIITILFFTLTAWSQKYTISGYIRDSESGEDLIGANIIVTNSNKGATTNTYGFYSLTLPAGRYTISYSYIGFANIERNILLDKDQTININLKATAYTTEEVVISGERTDNNVQDSRMSVVKLPVEQVKTLPAFMGEVDVLKTIQLLPGIQAAGDGNAGFYVRGGGPDQNLILLDEAPVYNAAHLFGFFSVFNADAIKDIEIYTGGMPAQYGGRISSVLDITMNNGNMKKYVAEGGIGTIASRLTVQGPIKKDTCSFLVSARRTYIDLLIQPFIKKESAFKGSGYYFYDINAKFNFKFSEKDRLFLSGYYGKDVFNFSAASGAFSMKIPWGNGTGTIRWNHLFNSRFFLNTTAVFSDYQFTTDVGFGGGENSDVNFRFIQYSGIRDYYFKQDYTWLPNPQHTIKFGAGYTFHSFTPNSVKAEFGETVYDFATDNKLYAHEASVYVGDNYVINDRITLYGGLRGASFFQVGPFTRYIKSDNMLLTIDSVIYNKGELVADYYALEPRASIKISIGKTSSFKASFMQNKQFIHLASLSASTLPTDLWVPSSDVVEPQKGRQYAVGYFRNFHDNLFETSIELYYKDLYNLIEYMDGALPGDELNDNSDNYFVFGDGNSYGAEVFLKKRTGRLTGWLGYTWSKTMRTFPDINDGIAFPAKYDRRHDLSLTMNYALNEKWTFATIFVYATGNTTTLPIARYMLDGEIISEYGPRNSYRMDPYHRLDLSITYTHKKTDKWESVWNFSVYNVYNRKNPYFIYFDYEGNIEDGNFKTIAKQVSLIPILPAITWNFKFM
jgi:hypothetical protein